jgi:chromosome segregation ATPase
MFASNEITQTTGALERLPRVLERQSAHTGKRQRITEEKHTDTLAPLTLAPPNAKAAGRQMTQLRKDNKHLRMALEDQRAEVQKLLSQITQLRSEFTVAHQGYQEDLAHYQTQLQELTDERNQLSETQQASEDRYQALEKAFQDTVQEEAHKLMQEATEAAIRSPEHVSPLLQEVVKTVELHVRQKEEKLLTEALCLKREVQRMAEFLEQERLQLQKEQQQLISFQLSVREQANARRKLLEERLYARQRVFSIVMSFALLALFIILEFACLALFHTPAVGSVALSILIPIVVCILLRIVLATPLSLIKTIYMGAPHKRRVKAQT